MVLSDTIRLKLTCFFISLVTVTLVCSPAPALSLQDGDITGHFSPKMHDDTLVVTYSLQYTSYVFDKVTFYTIPHTLDVNAEAGSRSSARTLELDMSSLADTTKGPEWNGRFDLAGYEHGIPQSYVLSWYQKTEDGALDTENVSVDTMGFYPAGDLARYARVGISFATRRDFPDSVQSDAYLPAWRIEDRIGRLSRHSAFWIGYSINHSGTFSLYDYAKTEFEVVPWTRRQGLPILGVGASYSRVKGRRGDTQFIDRGLATEVSLKIEGPFESVRYAYNTTAGGYNRADLVFSLQGGDPGALRMGTMYSVYWGKRVNMLSLSVYMGGGDTHMLERRNHRTIIHEALASIALLPLLPYALLMALDSG